MDPRLLGLLLFGALVFALAAVGLLLRDVFSWFGGKSSGGPLRLERLPTSRTAPRPGAVGQFDDWFARVARETGAGWSTTVALLFLVMCGLAVGGALFVWTDEPLLLGLGVLFGMAAGLMALLLARSRHLAALQEQLPGALEMLARAVRAGESLEQAMHLVGDKAPAPLGVEFRRCASQFQLGLSVSAVMKSLVARLSLPDVRVFTTTLAVHRETGGNLATTLERLAAVIRERLTYRRQMWVVTGAARVSATLVASIGPLLFLFMFFFQPEYVRGLLESPIGQSLLVIAVLLEVIGLIWVARLLQND